MKLKKIINYLIIIFISVLFSLIVFEFYASLNPQKFPSYGWQTNNIMQDKVDNCKKKPSKKKIGVFGDSFVEFYEETSLNLVEQLSKKFTSRSLCNFGISGNEITVYINRFLFSLDKGVNFDKVIFYLYEGNDFSSFRYHRKTEDYITTKIGNVTGIFNYNSQFTNDRRLSLLRIFVKSTYAINIIYREVIKKYLFANKINENYVREIYNQDTYFEVPIESAITRMKNTPKEVKKKFSSDLINSNQYKLALRNPNYYAENHRPDSEDFLIQKKIAFHHIDFINSLCEKNRIDCKFIVIPAPNFLFKEAKEIWKNIFRFNYYKEFGPSSIVSALISKYKNFHYPEEVLKYDDYIKIDMHLTGKGNHRLANFTYEKFTN